MYLHRQISGILKVANEYQNIFHIIWNDRLRNIHSFPLRRAFSSKFIFQCSCYSHSFVCSWFLLQIEQCLNDDGSTNLYSIGRWKFESNHHDLLFYVRSFPFLLVCSMFVNMNRKLNHIPISNRVIYASFPLFNVYICW